MPFTTSTLPLSPAERASTLMTLVLPDETPVPAFTVTTIVFVAPGAEGQPVGTADDGRLDVLAAGPVADREPVAALGALNEERIRDVGVVLHLDVQTRGTAGVDRRRARLVLPDLL